MTAVSKRKSRRPPPDPDPPAPGSMTTSLEQALATVDEVRTLIAGMLDTARRLGL